MTTTDPRARLDEIMARAESATEGPWEVRDDFPRGGGRVYEPAGYPLPGCFNCGENDAVYEEGDAEFIAHARTDLPTLVAALTAVLAVADQWEGRAVNLEASAVHAPEEFIAESLLDSAGNFRHSVATIRTAITDALGGDLS